MPQHQPQSATPIAANDAGHEVPHKVKEVGAATSARRRSFTLQEKLDIVREAKVPGVRGTAVARRHGIAVNQLYYWRKVYGDLLPEPGSQALTLEQRKIADLRVQVEKLETLLGQRTFEMALLQQRLAALEKPNAKK